MDDWEPSLSFDKLDIADGEWQGSCAERICDENDQFPLSEKPPD